VIAPDNQQDQPVVVCPKRTKKSEQLKITLVASSSGLKINEATRLNAENERG
jgi:hypothetical protein